MTLYNCRNNLPLWLRPAYSGVQQTKIMNLFDAVPVIVQQNFEGYSYDEIDAYQIATAVKELLTYATILYETLTTQNRI